MNRRRCRASLAVIALAPLAWAPAALAAPKADLWTPERVRAFVLKVEDEMDKLQVEEGQVTLPPMERTCWGMRPDSGLKKSVALPRIKAYLEGDAAVCYVLTYLGCGMGEWIGRPLGNFLGPLRKPFKRSKVTIIAQTADRVVADVTEISFEDDFDGDAKLYLGEDYVVPYTEAQVAAVKDSSRYTITRDKDGVWRISDRKPSFPWVCKNWPDEIPPGLN